MNTNKELRSIARNWNYPPDYYRRSAEALDLALDTIAVYESWKALDPGPDHPVDDRYAAMPRLTKLDIRTHFPRGILPPGMDIGRGLADGEIALVDTSGTTDEKITNIWNQKWWDASERSSWKLNAHMSCLACGEHSEAILANPRNVGFISDDADLPMEKRRLARFLFLNEKTDPTRWPEDLMLRMAGELDLFRPEVLEANPSLLARLSRFISKNGMSVFQPGVIVFTYEYATGIELRQIRKVFGSPTSSSYGSTETGFVFMECEAGRFHQNTDFCRVDFEPLKREHGGPLLGRILVTPFGNPWCRYVRFDVGDLVTLEESGACPCGRHTGMILSSINGRAANLTLTADGRPVTLTALDRAMSGLEGIEQYQMIQTDRRTYELHLVSRTREHERLSTAARQALKSIYGAGAVINTFFDADLPPSVSGKSLISRAAFTIVLDDYLEQVHDDTSRGTFT